MLCESKKKAFQKFVELSQALLKFGQVRNELRLIEKCKIIENLKSLDRYLSSKLESQL